MDRVRNSAETYFTSQRPFEAEKSDRSKELTNPKDFNQINENRIVGTSKLFKAGAGDLVRKLYEDTVGGRDPTHRFCPSPQGWSVCLTIEDLRFSHLKGRFSQVLEKKSVEGTCYACFGILRTSRIYNSNMGFLQSRLVVLVIQLRKFELPNPTRAQANTMLPSFCGLFFLLCSPGIDCFTGIQILFLKLISQIRSVFDASLRARRT
jgi:hypothetical protein